MTKEELSCNSGIPQVHKDAIERAIDNWALNGTEDKQWPDYYRGYQVDILGNVVLSEEDEVADDEYYNECVCFEAGWKATLEEVRKWLYPQFGEAINELRSIYDAFCTQFGLSHLSNTAKREEKGSHE